MDKIKNCLAALFLVAVLAAALHLLFGLLPGPVWGGLSEAAPLPQGFTAGASVPATGSLSNNTASTLSFTDTMHFVLVSNRAGAIAYFNLNTGSDTVHSSIFDFALDDGEELFIDWCAVENVTVYVSPTSGIRVVGWK